MENIIIYKEDRKKISIYFSHLKKTEIQLREDIYEKYKNMYIKDSYFQLICSQNQTEDFTFYKKCKILEIRNKSIYFEFESIITIKESELIKILRKEKLENLIYA